MTLENQFRNFDTKRADGTYVAFERVVMRDESASVYGRNANELLRKLKNHDEGMSLERATAYLNDAWYYVGIRARAHMYVVKNGCGTHYTIESAGLWGIESDSSEAYFSEVFGEEKASLLADLTTFASATEIQL